MSADADMIADVVATLDSSVRTGDEFEKNMTVVGGLYAIAAELAKLSKQLDIIARWGGGRVDV